MVLGLAAATLLLVGCGPRFVRESVYNHNGIQVVLRRQVRGGHPVSRGFSQPVAIAPVRVTRILARLEVHPKPGSTESKPAIPADLLYPLGTAISEGLAKADPTEEVVVTATRTKRRLGIFTEDRLTGLIVYVVGDKLRIDLAYLDWHAPDEPDAKKPEPWADRHPMPFRVVPASGITPVGAQSVEVAWRDPTFRDTGAIIVSPSGNVERRTILMESPPGSGPEGAPGPLPPNLRPETRRKLEALEADRRAGRITESEYRRRRRAILESDAGSR